MAQAPTISPSTTTVSRRDLVLGLTNSAYASNVTQLTVNSEKDNIGEWSLGFNLNRSYTIKKKVKTQ